MGIIIKKTIQYIYPLMNVLSAVGQTGFSVALFNKRYELIPEKGKVLYEMLFSATIGITVLISPFLGGMLRNLFLKTPVAKIEFGNIRAVYLISALLMGVLEVGYAYYLRTRFQDKMMLSRRNFKKCVTTALIKMYFGMAKR